SCLHDKQRASYNKRASPNLRQLARVYVYPPRAVGGRPERVHRLPTRGRERARLKSSHQPLCTVSLSILQFQLQTFPRSGAYGQRRNKTKRVSVLVMLSSVVDLYQTNGPSLELTAIPSKKQPLGKERAAVSETPGTAERNSRGN